MFQGRLDPDMRMIHLVNPAKTRQNILIIVFLENTGFPVKITVSQIMVSSLYIKYMSMTNKTIPGTCGDGSERKGKNEENIRSNNHSNGNHADSGRLPVKNRNVRRT